MKIVWLCNTLMEDISKQLGLGLAKPESWITGIYSHLRTLSSVRLFYLYPAQTKAESIVIGNTTFIPYFQKKPTAFEKSQVGEFTKIIEDVKPDIVHMFGTEFAQTWAMILACENCGILDKVVINIQGLVHICAKHFFAYLPAKVVYGFTLRDIVKRNNIALAQRSFIRRGKYEIMSLKKVRHVIGRTDWDEACTKALNSHLEYHFCNEILRSAFYKTEWKYEDCEKHSIFVSQYSYPIKGFHLILEAFVEIKKAYPDAKLYTTGADILHLNTKERIKETYYKRYLRKLIYKYGLEDAVFFLGYLNEQEMCERLRKTHVFVSPSSIENSPNSLGEAMIMGVPSVSSDVGGVKNLITHAVEGYLYPADEPYMITYYVKKIFDNREQAETLSQNARKHAGITHDQEKNIDDLLNIYERLLINSRSHTD